MEFCDKINRFIEGDISFIYYMLNILAFKLYNIFQWQLVENLLKYQRK